MDWFQAPEQRDQIVLFPTRLDDAVQADHSVRLLDDILGQLDWSQWEQRYQLKRGQPPIFYGLLNRIRSSRQLEAWLQARLDFRWLAEGRSIDHTTISKFRNSNAEAQRSVCTNQPHRS